MRRILLAASLVFFAGCQDDPMDSTSVNQAPETTASVDAPVADGDFRIVRAYWSGEDLDGSVVAYEVRVMKEAEGEFGSWERTTEVDREFVFSAEEWSGKAAAETMFELEVRAIDDDGAVDASPAAVRFSPLTLPPTVRIVYPPVVSTITCRPAAQVFTVGWLGDDPDSKSGVPAEVRYIVLLASQGGGALCLTQATYEATDPIGQLPSDDPRWSPWEPYHESVTLPPMQVGDKYLFAVQVKDEEGAVSKSFRWNREVTHRQVSPSLYPELILVEPLLGTTVAVGTAQLEEYDVLDTQTLRFEFAGRAEDYGGMVVDYRYGWDVSDPDDPNDAGWSVDWTEMPDGVVTVPTRGFSTGTHNFVAQIRDDSGSLTRVRVLLDIVQIPTVRRDLLLVDDWRENFASTPSDLERDIAWLERLNFLSNFQPSDVIDAVSESDQLNLQTLAGYKSVIWYTNADQQSFFARRLAQETTTTSRHNWLEVYQAIAGNVLFVGPGAATASLENDGWVYPIVFDVPTNPPFGFGTTDIGGTTQNRGTERYPYRAFCVESIEKVRPAVGFIFGEHSQPGTILRTSDCDAMGLAGVHPDFVQRFPSAGGPFGVVDLQPNQERVDRASHLQLGQEETYNSNSTSRPVVLFLRDCQVPMFRWFSRLYAGLGNCTAPSPAMLDTAPTAVASFVYSDSKPVPGSADFLWGFNPLGFEVDDVRAALRWITGENWQLGVNP